MASARTSQAWLWLYGANILQSIRCQWCLGPLNHFWSLAIEEHFYLLWPAVIYYTSRQSALRVCGLLFVASMVGRGLWLACGGNNVAAEVLTPLRMDGLVLGSALALLARAPGGLSLLRRWAHPTLLITLAAAVALDLFDRRLFGLRYTLWAAACGALLILLISAAANSRLAVFGHSRFLRFFGKYSYAIYVFQLPLVFLLAPLVTAGGLAEACHSPLLGQILYATILFSLTTVAALLSWQLFEKRLLALKTRFEPSK
jgi:peptidoglycan/LPS O-acetylase OafA/YrhL